MLIQENERNKSLLLIELLCSFNNNYSTVKPKNIQTPDIIFDILFY